MKIRVLIMDGPSSGLGWVSRQLALDSGIDVVQERATGLDLLLAVKRTAPHMVVLPLNREERPGIVSHLLGEYPDLKVLGIATKERLAFLYSLAIQEQFLGKIPERDVASAVRGIIG